MRANPQKGRPLSPRERATLEALRALEEPTPKQRQRREALALRLERYGDECPRVLRKLLRF